VLNLKDPVQLAALKKILAKADVFLSNMRQSALAKFGLDAETAHRVRPLEHSSDPQPPTFTPQPRNPQPSTQSDDTTLFVLCTLYFSAAPPPPPRPRPHTGGGGGHAFVELKICSCSLLLVQSLARGLTLTVLLFSRLLFLARWLLPSSSLSAD
jgi:hypothetical protein